jgi:hypothetical protein
MNPGSRVLGRSPDELNTIAMSIRPTQPPTKITLLGDRARYVCFDDALLMARETASTATPFAHSGLPISGLTSEFAPIDDEWVVIEAGETDVIERGEVVRRALDLNIDQIGQLAGSSGRRYQEYRNGVAMPAAKRAQFIDSMSVVAQLTKFDPWTTKTLFQIDPDAIACLNRRDFNGLWTRFFELRARLAETKKEFSREIGFIAESENLSAIRDLAQTSDFDIALQLLEKLAPQTHAHTEKWRVLAGLDLFEAIKLYDQLNELTERWSFMARFTDDELKAFQNEAVSVLGNEHTREAEWVAWLEQRRKTADASLRVLALAPPISGEDGDGPELFGIGDLIAKGGRYTLPAHESER